MGLEAFIANRYLSKTRNSFSVSLLKWLGMMGVALGVFSLIVVISIMRGFEEDFEAKILGFQAPLVLEVESRQQQQLPPSSELQSRYSDIKAAERRVEGELVIEGVFGSASGARIRGLSGPVEEMKGLGSVRMAEGGDPNLEPEVGLPGILLGSELAASLQVHPDFNDEVTLVFPFGDVTPTGEIAPRVRRFRVAGIFDSGFYEYDSKFAIISEGMARRLFGPYGRHSVALYLDDATDSESLRTSLLIDYPNAAWQAFTWRERNERLFQALLLERLGMLVLLMMIVLIATFNIFALLSMIVMEKVKDMAILRTIGLRLSQVRRVFLWQVTKIGIRGTLIGGIAGIIVCLWFYLFPYELPASYYIEHLPVLFDPVNIALMMALGPVISLLAGWYPARQACRPIIAEVLRYE